MNYYIFPIFYDLLIRSEDMEFFALDLEYNPKFALLFDSTAAHPQLCQSLCRRQPAALLKKRLWHRCFQVNFMKFQRKVFLQNTSGRLLLFIPIFWFLNVKLVDERNIIPATVGKHLDISDRAKV